MILDKFNGLSDDDITAEKLNEMNIKEEDLMDEISLVYNPEQSIDYNIYDTAIKVTSEFKAKEKGIAPFSEVATLILSFMQSRGLDNRYSLLILYILKSPGKIVNLLTPFVEKDPAYNILLNEYNRYISNSMGYLQLRADILQQETNMTAEEMEKVLEEAKKILAQRG